MKIEKLLVVDDDEDIRTVTRLTASRVGHWEVAVAASGLEALEVAAEKVGTAAAASLGNMTQPVQDLREAAEEAFATNEELGDTLRARTEEMVWTAEQAREDHALMMHYVQLMLCAGIVHGDLSEFNVLVDEYGPVVIDLPQAVDAAANNNAQEMFARDVNKITDYYAVFAPELRNTRYAKEMWGLYEEGELLPETRLTGLFEEDLEAANVDSVLEEIKAVMAEEASRLERMREAEEPD